MKLQLELSQEELQEAVGYYLRGAKDLWPTGKLRIQQHGFPNSPDPREQGVSYTATIEVETK